MKKIDGRLQEEVRQAERKAHPDAFVAVPYQK